MQTWLSIHLDGADGSCNAVACAADDCTDDADAPHVVVASLPIALPAALQKQLADALTAATPRLEKQLPRDVAKHLMAVNTALAKKPPADAPPTKPTKPAPAPKSK